MGSGYSAVSNYHTLRALVLEWGKCVAGSRIAACYAQSKGELTISLSGLSGFGDAGGGSEGTLRLGLRSPELFMVLQPGHNRARRNTVSLFESLNGRTVKEIALAEGDRILELGTTDGIRLYIELFGSHANAYLLEHDGVISSRFRDVGREPGTVPGTRTRPIGGTVEGRFSAGEETLERAIQRAAGTFHLELAREAAFRAGEDASGSRVAAIVDALLRELESPEPAVYYSGDRPLTFSLVELSHLDAAGDGVRRKVAPSVNDGVSLFLRHSQAWKSFSETRGPLESSLGARLERLQRARATMERELAGQGRAERYERFGHILMAFQHEIRAGAASVSLADVFGDGNEVTIALEPDKDAVRNAEQYYRRARQSRASREAARRRLDRLEAEESELTALLLEISGTKTAREVASFKENRAEELQRLLSSAAAEDDRIPYRRYSLGQDYEVWVGRNATQNDRLTLREAAPHDYWLHARGVPGSHAVLRVPRRAETPPASILEAAAAVAAWFSKARGSSLVPVICTQRKYVRKPRKSPPGTVVVEREDVILVRPALPSGKEGADTV